MSRRLRRSRLQGCDCAGFSHREERGFTIGCEFASMPNPNRTAVCVAGRRRTANLPAGVTAAWLSAGRATQPAFRAFELLEELPTTFIFDIGEGEDVVAEIDECLTVGNRRRARSAGHPSIRPARQSPRTSRGDARETRGVTERRKDASFASLAEPDVGGTYPAADLGCRVNLRQRLKHGYEDVCRFSRQQGTRLQELLQRQLGCARSTERELIPSRPRTDGARDTDNQRSDGTIHDTRMNRHGDYGHPWPVNGEKFADSVCCEGPDRRPG
ncbi:hypothetical protein JOE66_001718 [Subtercola frigoramans]|uniref:Uncharacterized protein n=1 Tax=Subtercola frigoramans TaxID=120298 RepID=A0ABS2L4Z0_9MICO|nr:hypothetical protein [Subtercola frigoramans]